MKMHRLTLSSRGSEIQQLRDEVAQLHKDLAFLIEQVTGQRTPARTGWQRYTSPIDSDIADLPTKHLLAVKPDPEIHDITIDQFDYVRVYNQSGQEMLQHSGPAELVEALLRRRAPHIKWLPVYTRLSAPVSGNPSTPVLEALMPDTSRSLV